MATHISKLAIKNDQHKIISITCDKTSKNPLINAKDYTTLCLLPFESTGYKPITELISINENESFTITITEKYPEQKAPIKYTFCYSQYSTKTAIIETSKSVAYPSDKGEDKTDEIIRYMGFHNSAPYIADFIVSYRSDSSSSWTDKKIDYFNAGRGTDKCGNQKDYPNGVYDLSKMKIPNGYEVTAKVNAQGGIGSGDNARSKAIFVYHKAYANRVAKYKCGGTSCDTSINNPSATNL